MMPTWPDSPLSKATQRYLKPIIRPLISAPWDLVSLLFGSLGATGGLGTNSYLEDSLLFPYTSGMKFVNVLKEKGGWPAVDSVYGKPPLSTEQVIHPRNICLARRRYRWICLTWEARSAQAGPLSF